ncbi:agmatinase, mitochondrial [Fukomys damarensis]|nr:agmatinase, mitochondrial [Fukomys damarensis]
MPPHEQFSTVLGFSTDGGQAPRLSGRLGGDPHRKRQQSAARLKCGICLARRLAETRLRRPPLCTPGDRGVPAWGRRLCAERQVQGEPSAGPEVSAWARLFALCRGHPVTSPLLLPRFGPRRIREESAMLRAANPSTGALPFQALAVADLGDVNVNLYDLQDSCRRVREAFQKIVAAGCVPLTMGGDHTITYPILQAMAEKHGPVGLLHVDAHTDTADKALGQKLYHGSPFRRAVDEGLLDCRRVVQIGVRGSAATLDPHRYSRSQGFRVVLAEECWFKSLVPLMAEVRQHLGGKPLYISFDIDALDPAYAPGTGTPEIAGLAPSQALEIIRGCQGLNVVGGDLVEVSPQYDVSGNTALLAANLLFEMLCVLPRVMTA